MQNAHWPTADGKKHEFEVYSPNVSWNSVGGIYIFTYLQANNYWKPLYIGQTEDFSQRIPNHERWAEAVRRGATHIHVKVVSHASTRDVLELMLIKYCQPPMNDKLR